MASITVTKALSSFFNVGDGKRPLPVWSAELKALTPEEKADLARQVCEVTGDELVTA